MYKYLRLSSLKFLFKKSDLTHYRLSVSESVVGLIRAGAHVLGYILVIRVTESSCSPVIHYTAIGLMSQGLSHIQIDSLQRGCHGFISSLGTGFYSQGCD